MSERIYDERHDHDPDHVLHVETTTDTGALRLLVIDGEQVAAIQLSKDGARSLRLALTRWEKAQS